MIFAFSLDSPFGKRVAEPQCEPNQTVAKLKAQINKARGYATDSQTLVRSGESFSFEFLTLLLIVRYSESPL